MKRREESNVKRDMGLIRDLVLEVEKRDSPFGSKDLELESRTPEEIACHLEWMIDDQLLRADDQSTLDDKYPVFVIYRLTSKGCDFAETFRKGKFFTRVLKQAQDLGVPLVVSEIFKLAFAGLK